MVDGPRLHVGSPARAGRTGAVRGRCCGRGVHPRARGGTREPLSPFQRLQGSSPRARGDPRGGPESGAGLRFIPASAGARPLAADREDRGRSIPPHAGWIGALWPVAGTTHGLSTPAFGQPEAVAQDFHRRCGAWVLSVRCAVAGLPHSGPFFAPRRAGFLLTAWDILASHGLVAGCCRCFPAVRVFPPRSPVPVSSSCCSRPVPPTHRFG